MKFRYYRFISDGIAHDGIEVWWRKRMLCRMHSSTAFACGALVLMLFTMIV